VIDPTARIHSSAELEPDVSIGPEAVVRQRAVIRHGAVIGAESQVGRDVLIDTEVSIGARVRIDDHALIYRGVMIEDAVIVGPAAILTNDRYPRAVSLTGELSGAGDEEAASIVLREGSTIGASAVVVGGVEIGASATVAAGGIVTRNVPGHALVAGNPARRIGWVCACGRRLRDSTGHDAPAEPERYALDTDLVCETCGRHYGYVPDEETLEERVAAPPQKLPA
jgi:UDP-2-acetamido-3-amino-2,3-dideoxy-glucuronate N-acetyltransferase